MAVPWRQAQEGQKLPSPCSEACPPGSMLLGLLGSGLEGGHRVREGGSGETVLCSEQGCLPSGDSAPQFPRLSSCQVGSSVTPYVQSQVKGRQVQPILGKTRTALLSADHTAHQVQGPWLQVLGKPLGASWVSALSSSRPSQDTGFILGTRPWGLEGNYSGNR